jgi:two-component system, NarL family, captular synthesis response regulator RcsB
MFHKVLVAEDLDSISITVGQALEELSVPEIHHAKYCDEALLKVKKALYEEAPYDLLISDLSFKIDHRETQLHSGDALIAAVKKLQPNIKIIVFSIEDKSFRIKSLFNDLGINAFVAKGRNSIPELEKAIQSVYNNNSKIVSPEMSHVLKDKTLIEIEVYDIMLLKSLSKGFTIEETALDFKNTGILPNGSSSIEKRINKLKIFFKANNNVHLIAIAKDLGLV